MITAKIVSLVAKTVLIGLPLVAIAPSVSANPKMASKLKLLPTTTNQRQTSALNPHPSIFAQAPYNRSQLMLRESLRLAKQVQKPANSDAENSTPSQSEVKPWSESQENRKALVKAINGQFNIRLRNLTNTEVTYELVGHTNQRQLTGNNNFMLEDLAMPVTVTVLREDGGLIRVTPKPVAPGILELRLDEALNLDQDRRAVRVREGGSLLIY
ncbi:hypothetical protein [Chlorogloea sp. CCALA 695]|uniref:hypothetical protein n=1 Tax=Chlorogloea sp. CCALA 695 TaxID=2107693 RepID=UPI000D0541BB|nr:hypothetical protein [Chlorogloea sp. CCALA 695]PSB31032.1 hypothetical protein C7B70_14560 [Chlorogloea sp. CCALA 695]